MACTTPWHLWLFIYHCAVFCSHSCGFPSAAAISIIPIKAFLTGMLVNGSRAARPTEKGASISCNSNGRSAKNCKGRVPNQTERESHYGKGGTRKGEEKKRACHLSLQDSCKVLIMCFIHSSPLFSNHLLRDISKKGRRGRD